MLDGKRRVDYDQMPYRRVFGRFVCKCQRCGFVWLARGQMFPKRCASCKNRAWDRPLMKPGPKPGTKRRKK